MSISSTPSSTASSSTFVSDANEPRYVPRPRYLDLLRRYRDSEHVKVLQGIRRCGKSALLSLVVDELRSAGVPASNIYRRRFDAFDAFGVRDADALGADIRKFLAQTDGTRMAYVFLDEIQEVEGWERVVRALHTQRGVDVYITGSNAYLLSSDLATYLAGRYVAIDVSPLSFAEYLDFRVQCDGVERGSWDLDAEFADYMRHGGMPSLFALRDRTHADVVRELGGIYDSVVINDVARRLAVRDMAQLTRLAGYLASTSGNLFSTRKVVGAMRSAGWRTSNDTVDSYIDALERAYIIAEAPQEGLRGKELLNPLRKFYFADTGLRNLAARFPVEDTGFQLENVVACELMRRGYALTVGALPSPGGEVDFVARGVDASAHADTAAADTTIYVQVTQSLADDAVFERELALLRAIRDSFTKIVITRDFLREGVTDDGIRIIPVTRWLLGDW